jgi:hypothetical protein
MPVARSDSRRSTVVGLVGLVLSSALIILGLVALSDRDDDSQGTERLPPDREFRMPDAAGKAAEVAQDGPLLFQDPATFNRPIFVQHLGEDPVTGWSAFDAVAPDCRRSLDWQADRKVFVDPCSNRELDAEGGDQFHYETKVQADAVLIDLNPE